MYFYNKKKVYFFVIIIFCFFLFNKNVWANTKNDSFVKTYISGYSYVDSTSSWGNFEKFVSKTDNSIAYCIEPGTPFSGGLYEGNYDLSNQELANFVSLTKEQLEKISEIAYFGWGYENHNDDEWIVATQALIWKYLGRDFHFTSKNNSTDPWAYVINTPDNIKNKMDEIENLVSSLEKIPTFNGNLISVPLNTTYQVVDNNYQINNYQITNCSNCIANIVDNKLFITPQNNARGSISLERKMNNWNTSFIVYNHAVSQNLLVPGNISNKIVELSYQVISGKLNLKKYDLDSKSCQPKESGSLAGSIYKLYKNDGTYIKDLVINDECEASIDGLELGEYYIMESKAGLNYELDLNKYYFELSLENSEQDLIVYDKMYLGQVRLEKIDSITNSCQSISSYATLKGAIYGIYKKDHTLVDKLIIDDNCSAVSKRNLLLGDYYLKEIKAPIGYELDTKKHFFSITKDNADDIVLITVKEKAYETNLILNKTYYGEIGIIEEPGATFEIYSKKDNNKITTITTDNYGIAKITLPFGEYIIRQVSGKEGYKFIDDIVIIVSEETDKTSFLQLINEPIIGNLLIHKIDLDTGINLSGAIFEIYDEHGRLIYQGKTDDNGTLLIDNLRYGKYYLIEKEAPLGYAKQEEPIYFEITKSNQVVNITIPNEQEIIVPNTKMNRNNIPIIINLIFLIIGIKILKNGKKSL